VLSVSETREGHFAGSVPLRETAANSGPRDKANPGNKNHLFLLDGKKGGWDKTLRSVCLTLVDVKLRRLKGRAWTTRCVLVGCGEAGSGKRWDGPDDELTFQRRG
jgi:hypothetical protein